MQVIRGLVVGLLVAGCNDPAEHAPLLRSMPEPPGTNCQRGGTAIVSGLDDNDNGVLDPSEVSSTTYVCAPPGPAVIEGSVIVHNSVEVAELDGVETITGDLTIDAPGLTSTSLGSLQMVGGSINIVNFSGTTIGFPSLVSAGWLRVLDNASLAAISVPAITSLNRIDLTAPAMTSISFPQLVSVRFISLDKLAGTSFVVNTSFPLVASLDTLEVSAWPNLTSLSLGTADVTKAVTIDGNPLLATIDLNTLTDTGMLMVGGNPALTAIGVSALATISKTLYISNNDALAALVLPSLTAVATELDGQAQIEGNNVLQSISAPGWTVFGAARYFGVNRNNQLPTCAAQALATQVGATNIDISGNNSAGTCP